MKTGTRRTRGGGTLVKRGKVFFARWTLEGKTYTQTTGTSSRREAEARLEEFTAPFRLGSEAQALETLTARLGGVQEEIARHEDSKPALPLANAWKAYTDSQKRPDSGEGTLATYELQFNRFVSWMTSNFPKVKELRDVTEAQAEAFSRNLAKERSPNTHNKYITLLRAMWRILGKVAKATGNPWDGITLKTLDTHSRRALTLEELATIYKSVDGEMKTLFGLGLYTGLRLGDCALLKWSSVDMVRRIITAVPSKTARHTNGKAVIVPIHSALLSILSESYRQGLKGFVLPELAEMYHRDHTALTKQIQSIFEACGIQTQSQVAKRSQNSVDVGFHSLRHTFVSLSANAGTPLAVVQSIVGHSSQAMTEHYYHASADAVSKAVNALPSMGDNVPQIEAEAVQKFNLEGMTESELKALIADAKAELKSRSGSSRAPKQK